MISSLPSYLSADQANWLAQFDVGKVIASRELPGGMFSRPLALETERGAFVLRQHRFRDAEASFQFQAETIAAAADAGIRCPRVLQSKSGKWALPLSDGRGVMALHEFCKGNVYDWQTWQRKKDDNPEFLFELGVAVAQLHNVLSEARPRGDSEFAHHLPPIQFGQLQCARQHWQTVVARLEQSSASEDNKAASRLLQLRDKINWNWERLSEAARQLAIADLPMQIVHGDISPVNLVFADADRLIDQVAFIDWDCVHVGHRLYDALGDILQRPPVEHPEYNEYRRDHLQRYLEGYAAAVDPPISDAERRCTDAFSLARQLEDLRQRAAVVQSLADPQQVVYAQLIELRVSLMEQIDPLLSATTQ